MKINDSQRISNVQNAYGKAKAVGDTGTGAAKRKDQVSISTEALELLQSQQVNNAGRAEKIEELKSSVASGTYNVEAGKIAEKLWPFIR